jgi:predicted component of type VI protein secretion system
LFDDLPPTLIDPLPEDFSRAAAQLFRVDQHELERSVFQGIERFLKN